MTMLRSTVLLFPHLPLWALQLLLLVHWILLAASLLFASASVFVAAAGYGMRGFLIFRCFVKMAVGVVVVGFLI